MLKTFALRAITVVALVGVAMPLNAAEHDAEVRSNRGVSADARQEAQALKETESEKSKDMQKRSTGGKRLKKFVLGAIKTAVVVTTVKTVMPRKTAEQGRAADQDSRQHASERKKEWGASQRTILLSMFVLIGFFLRWRRYRQTRKQKSSTDNLDDRGRG